MAAADSLDVIGIIGAGKLGKGLGQRAVAGGHRTLIAGSGEPRAIRGLLQLAVPGAEAMTSREVIEAADVVILALPLAQHGTLPASSLAGKVVIDAMNYWWESDGIVDEYVDPLTSTSEIVQSTFADARVVKAFNHVGYHDVEDLWADAGSPDRIAVAIAGDDADAVARVARVVDSFGFDPLPIGSLRQGVMLEPNTMAFGASEDAAGLQRVMAMFPKTARGRAVLAARGGHI